MARANGLACCNRATNIAWRHMHYALVCGWLQGLINHMMEPEIGYNLDDFLRSLIDLADVIGLET